MNTMNMPGFTAETSLYKTSGHYQAGRHAINSSTQMISAIYPAEIKEEIIYIEGTAPLPLPWGWGPGGWGGSGNTGTPGVPSNEGSGGGSGSGSGGTRRPMRIETLGQGPKFSQIKRLRKCIDAGVDAKECYSCSGTVADRVCNCYYCTVSGDACTLVYDCTNDYGKTG